MFSTFRHYPIFELLFSNSPIALIITRNKQLKIYKVKPILGKFFFTEEGWFNIDQKYSLAHFKQRVYIYDATNINPIPTMLLSKIEKLSDSKQYNTFVSQIEDIKKDDSPKNKETTDALETLSPQSNIDPTTLIALKDYTACDPQLLAVGTSHIMQIEKLLKKRSQSITASFPIKFIFIVIAVIMCIAVFSGDISLALDETFSKMGLNFGTAAIETIPDVTPETITEPTTNDTEITP